MKPLLIALILLFLPVPAGGQSKPAADPFQALRFLEQNWEANTGGVGGIKATGTYAFRRELGGHVLARHSTGDAACKGPANFDCEHGDILYVFQDAPGQLKAIYFDNEGHVIHYDVSTPSSTSVVFLSEASRPGPQFRLTYELKNSVLFGKFQSRMPGDSEWKSYLEWSGPKRIAN